MDRRLLLKTLLTSPAAAARKKRAVSDGFASPLVGGGGGLVYPSIHSPNFVPGSSGWTINKDGSAEFDNLTIRGTFQGVDFLVNTAGAFFYSPTEGAGNLIASVTPQGGNDLFGNAYQAGVTAYTGTHWTELGGGRISMFDPLAAVNGFISHGLRLLQLFPSAENLTDMLGFIGLVGGASNGQVLIAEFPASGSPPSISTSATLEVQGEVAVTTGGAQVTGNSKVTGSLEVTAGLTVDASGASVTGGLTTDTETVTGALTATGGTATSPTLITTDTTHGLGALGVANLMISTANYVLCPDGRVFISIVGIATGAVVGGTATFPNALAVGYRPATEKLLPAEYGGTITAGEQRPRLQVNTNGQVTLAFPTLANGNLVSAGGYMDLQ